MREIFETVSDLCRNAHRLIEGNSAASQSLREVSPPDHLHGEEVDLHTFVEGCVFETIDLRDTRVIERRQQPGFAFEASQALWVLSEGAGQDLDRDIPAELRIPGAIDLAHATRADGTNNLIRSEAGAGF
ncbi:MAG: hypothetical protein ABIP62_00915 [Vicinamibacteria bacterium]